MITNELVSFIKAQRAAGKDDNFIRQTLLASGGWDHSDVDEALAIAGPSGLAVPKAPQPPAPPVQSTPRIQVMPSAPPAPSTPPAPAPVPNPVPNPVSASAPQPAAPQASAQNHQWSPMGGAFSPRPNPVSQPISQVPVQAMQGAPSFSAPQPSASIDQSQDMSGRFMPHQQTAFASRDLSSSAPKPGAPSAPRSSHKGVLALAIVLLLIACGAGYAYLGGYLSFQSVSDPVMVNPQALPETTAETQATSTNATSTDITFEEIESFQIDDSAIEDLDLLMQEEF